MTTNQKIIPSIWFNNQAKDAAQFYTTVFGNAGLGDIYTDNGKTVTVNFEIDGYRFSAINGGPMFRVNPSISFYTICETVEEIDEVWKKLSENGTVRMELDSYPWNDKYGWIEDKYGVNWQLSLGSIAEVGQKFSPVMMFTGEQHGRAMEAINFYTSIFDHSSIDLVAKYEAGDADKATGTVKHARFTLEGNVLMAMDSSLMHGFQFNEGISLMVTCRSQEEVDYFWDKLTAQGGSPGQCGWLKDPFGVSWQIVPVDFLEEILDAGPEKFARIMGALMMMQKIDIETIRAAAKGETKPVVTVQTTIAAPKEKVWQMWTRPEDIVHWNNASDEWHTPSAKNDLQPGGVFNYRMEARDGSMGFDFSGKYTTVEKGRQITYEMDDGRAVQVHFSEVDGGVFVMENFEAESTHSLEMQQQGWQAILDNFKKYVEQNT